MGTQSLQRRHRASHEVLAISRRDSRLAKLVGRIFLEIKVYFLAFWRKLRHNRYMSEVKPTPEQVKEDFRSAFPLNENQTATRRTPRWRQLK